MTSSVHAPQNVDDGYLIQNDRGYYLSRGFFWYPQTNLENVWVHPESVFKEDFSRWESKPITAIPARQEPDKITITGNPIPF